jgi:hypothetical protein
MRLLLTSAGIKNTSIHGALVDPAAGIPGLAYAIDDQTAIKVTDGTVEVISEGHWKLFNASPQASESR